MSRRRKHMTLGSEQQDVGPPQEGQAIVRALGSRGSNLVEVGGRAEGWGQRHCPASRPDAELFTG